MKGSYLRVAIWTVAVLACLPAVGVGDVVRLKDGSTIKGTVVSLVGDTLSVRTSFGATLRVPRATIALVSFTDSLTAIPPALSATQPAKPAARPAPNRSGQIGITFVDDKLSSKIEVERRRDESGHLRANWIEVLLFVDDAVVYSTIDSTMDKTIYNGPVRVYKNTIELEDFHVDVPAGFHHAALVVRNVGFDEYKDDFDGGPLDVRLNLDNMQVAAGKTVRVRVGIDRGKLRMGKPSFKREE
jgi:hypothetical protein